MSSFDAVNYAIRPNKAVERKVAFSGLAKVSRIVDLSGHRYVGLGSLWFVDFIMAHRVLGIDSMTSIEMSEIGFTRCEFNRPLGCIEVIKGESTLVIPNLDLESKPSVIWLDYDTSIGGPVLPDVRMLAARCAPNSVLMVTINAKKDELPQRDGNDEPLEEEESLRQIAGDLVPLPLPPKALQRDNFPKLLCAILANGLENATVRSGRTDSFIKLFDLAYSDGTPMVTVGGIIAAPDKAEKIRTMVKAPGWEGIVPETIAIPPLTFKEKLALDRMMPSPQPPTDAQLADIGFQLKRTQIDTYYRHYLHYPTFGEIFL